MLQDQTEAECCQQRFEWPAIQKSNDPSLNRYTDQTGDQERRGNRNKERVADGVGHQYLYNICCVGTQHDQLTMGHVDDAHYAKSDRQTNGRKSQNRSKRETKKHNFDHVIDAQRLLDRRNRLPGFFSQAGGKSIVFG